MYGLGARPWLGWSAGTLFGALLGAVLPTGVLNALDVAIYGMFVAIVIPPSKKSWAVALTVVCAALLSCAFSTIGFTGGVAIIVCAVLSAAIFAYVKPIESEASEK